MRPQQSSEAALAVDSEFEELRPSLERSARRMEILSEVAARLLAGQDPEREVLPALFDDIETDIGVDVVFSFTPDPLSEELRLTGVAGQATDDCTGPLMRVPYGEGIVGQVAATHQPIHLSNIQSGSDPREAHARARGHRAYAAEPILQGRRLIGVLSFGSLTRDRFDAEDHRFFQAAARNMGLAFDRARKDEQLAECNRELQHRVKNMLSMVHAIALLSAGSSHSVGDYTSRLSERLIALGTTEDLLREDNDQRAALRALICAELHPFDQPGRLRLKGPRVLLEPSLAVFMGMAIHELTTNAVKYGALSTPKGSIRAEWSVEPTASTRRLCLQWIERGGPAVAEPGPPGFGTRLLDQGLGGQIRASRRFTPDGLEAFIEIALD